MPSLYLTLIRPAHFSDASVAYEYYRQPQIPPHTVHTSPFIITFQDESQPDSGVTLPRTTRPTRAEVLCRSRCTTNSGDKSYSIHKPIYTAHRNIHSTWYGHLLVSELNSSCSFSYEIKRILCILLLRLPWEECEVLRSACFYVCLSVCPVCLCLSCFRLSVTLVHCGQTVG